jgi:hypothetical protein
MVIRKRIPRNTGETIHRTFNEFHDQVDTKWIVIRGTLRRRNDVPCGWPTPGGWPPLTRIWCFQLLIIRNKLIFFFNIVRLIVASTFPISGDPKTQTLFDQFGEVVDAVDVGDGDGLHHGQEEEREGAAVDVEDVQDEVAELRHAGEAHHKAAHAETRPHDRVVVFEEEKTSLEGENAKL